MKFRCLIFLMLLSFTGSVFSQEVRLRKRYIHFGYADSDLKIRGVERLGSNTGLFFTVGKSYFLHREPVAGILRFGIDATWFDLNFARYDQPPVISEFVPECPGSRVKLLEIGVQTGPSVTINPVGKLRIHLYGRFAPSFGMVSFDSNQFGGFTPLFVTGGTLSWGLIGLGVEYRAGKCRYSRFGAAGESYPGIDESELDRMMSGDEIRLTTSGVRFSLGFRF